MARPDVIQIVQKSVGGRKVLDIRRCITITGGGLIPTSRGVSIPMEFYEEFMDILQNGKKGVIILK